MKGIIEEFGMTAIYVVIGVALIAAILSFSLTDNKAVKELPSSNVIEAVNPKYTSEKPPTLKVSGNIYVKQGKAFYPLLFVEKAEDSMGRNIKNRVRIFGERGQFVPADIDTSVIGKHKIRYAVQDENGLWAWSESVVEVRGEED